MDADRETRPLLKRWVVDPVVRAFNPQTYGSRSWRGLSSQFFLVTMAALAYFGVRMITKGAEIEAFRNAESLIHFERRIGLYIEEQAQQLILDSRWIVTLFNWVYIWFHWPVILFAFFYLYRQRRSSYVLFRNAIFVSGAIGLIIFTTYPVAPPRFLAGFTDTVTELSTSYKFLQPPSIVNKYAALPSFHVGWNVLAGVMIWQATKFTPLRVFSVLSPVLMTAAVVFTANHYVIDAIVGVAISMMGLGGAVVIRRISQRYTREPSPEPAERLPVPA